MKKIVMCFGSVLLMAINLSAVDEINLLPGSSGYAYPEGAKNKIQEDNSWAVQLLNNKYTGAGRIYNTPINFSEFREKGVFEFSVSSEKPITDMNIGFCSKKNKKGITPLTQVPFFSYSKEVKDKGRVVYEVKIPLKAFNSTGKQWNPGKNGFDYSPMDWQSIIKLCLSASPSKESERALIIKNAKITLESREIKIHHSYESAIKKFEADDKISFPPPGEVLFIGSSSIRLWEDLPDYFPEHKVIQRGFGGSQIEDSIYFADRIAIPYKPSTIVMYAGDNDIASGKTPERVLNDFKKFVKKVREHLPDTKFIYISIKPSLKRWHLIDKIREANKLIAEYANTAEGVEFADIHTAMLDKEGRPRAELLRKDQLHLLKAGYKLWADIIKSKIKE